MKAQSVAEKHYLFLNIWPSEILEVILLKVVAWFIDSYN